MEQTICRSCGANSTGRYCAACGQPRPRPDDFSLRRMLAETWAELSDTDSRLWRSLFGLVIPGRLTRAWLDHEWSRHLPPLRLYLIASGVYFLLAWDVGFRFNAEMMRSAPAGVVPAQMLALFNDPAAADRVSDLTALLKFLFVVPMGLWLALLHWGNRRPVGEHMVFALHYTTVDFALFSLMAPAIAFAPDDLQVLAYSLNTQLALLLLGLWAIFAVRRVYRRSWLSSVVRGLAVLLMDVVLSQTAGQLAGAIVLSTTEWPA
jgi:hypothetical protein